MRPAHDKLDDGLVRLVLSRDLDAEIGKAGEQSGEQFMDGLRAVVDCTEWSYIIARTMKRRDGAGNVVSIFGCDVLPNNRVASLSKIVCC